MRSWQARAIVLSWVMMLGIAGLALPAGAQTASPASPGSVDCVGTDPRIAEGGGLVVLPDGYAVVNDGGTRIEVFILDESCSVREVRTAPIDPYDVEDLAIGPDGALWLADTGDNLANRASVAVEILTADGVATLHRLRYPDGPRDAEAMLVDGQGRAVIVTKTISGRSGVYRSPPITADTPASEPLELVKVGEFVAQQTGTGGGPIGPPVSNLMVTGAASCDETIALRTYTDAYVFAAGDDPAQALVEGEPTVLALPASPQGESIALSADCQRLYVHSEGVGQPITALEISGIEPADPAQPAAEPVWTLPATGDRSRTLMILGGVVAVAVLGGLVARRGRRR